jgi:hypothetical protein
MRLARRAADSGALRGLWRSEISAVLGEGAPCASLGRGGAGRETYCYSIGRLPQRTAGGTPILVIEFDVTRKSVAIRALHTQ